MAEKKISLITGGTSRLGREMCLAFARKGWTVFCHYRSLEIDAIKIQNEIRELGEECFTIKMDLNNDLSAKKMLAEIKTLTGKTPHCIINNAAIFEEDTALSTSTKNLLNHFQTNTITPLLLAIELHKSITKENEKSHGEHCAIHILDQKVHNLNPDYFSYTVSKLALERSVALQAQALAPLVRVCGISPGLSYLSGNQTEENFEISSKINLLQEKINPENIAKCAVFIAENKILNGCTLKADNGQHLIPLKRDVMFETPTPLPL